MKRSFFVVLILAALRPAALRAEDWPEFRGPTAQGHASGPLPTEWAPDKNVKWKQEIPGSGWSSPVVVGGKVFLTTADPAGKGLSLRALCLDADSGKILWNAEVFAPDAKNTPKIHGKNSHASPTPIVANGRVYVHFGHQGTACLDAAGKILWKNSDLAYAPVHGNGGSPVLVEGLLVFSVDGASVRKLVALDAGTGKVKWQTPRQGKAARNFSFGTPLVLTLDGKKQIVSPGSDMVGGYDVPTGKELWFVKYSGYSVIPRPVFADGMAYFATGYDTSKLLAVDLTGTLSGDMTSRIKWRKDRDAPHTPSMLLVGGDLYYVSDGGMARCVDAKTGKEHWSKRLTGGGYSASILHADGKVYFQSEKGVGTVVKASREKCDVVAVNDMKERTLASLAAADGAIYLRTETALYKIGK